MPTEIPYSRRERGELFQRLEHDLARVRDAMPGLMAQAHESAPNGYPPSSLGNNGTGRRTADSTSSAVLVRLQDGIATGSPLERLLGELHLALEHIHNAELIRAALMPPITAPDTAGYCQSCLRLRHYEVARTPTAPDCWWCYRLKRERGEYPPLPLLALHHRGERMTVNLVERGYRGLL